MRLNVVPLQKGVPLPNHGLTGEIGRVRLSGYYQLDGMFPVRQNASQAFGIAQQKIRPLVSGEAARKSQGQRVEVEDPLGQGHVFRRRSLASPFARQTAARVLDQS